MTYFRFHQNNSGGYFDKEMGYTIWIEATTPDEANAIAEENGVYFAGTLDGTDCNCCGDRWSPAGDYDAYDQPFWSTFAKNWDLDHKIIPYGQPMRTMKQSEAAERE